MIYSMTAFSRIQHLHDGANLVCEMRSINHRYLEISTHLPESLRALEMPIRELIRQHLKRGKVECAVRYQSTPSAGNQLISINAELARELCRASDEVAAFLKNAAAVSPADILRFPGVIEAKESDTKKIQEEVFHLLEKAIEELLAAREGTIEAIIFAAHEPIQKNWQK